PFLILFLLSPISIFTFFLYTTLFRSNLQIRDSPFISFLPVIICFYYFIFIILYTVERLTPVCLAISSPVSFCSSYKNLISLFLWSGNEGRPPFRPLALAASSPFFVRSLS